MFRQITAIGEPNRAKKQPHRWKLPRRAYFCGRFRPAALPVAGQGQASVLWLPWQAMATDEFFYQGGYASLLEVTDEQGQTKSMALETERLGMSRQVICQYPPTKLRFGKDSVKGTLIEGQTPLKRVTHCDKRKAYKQYQVLEALAYRMYNQVSNFGFGVRPLSLTYIDSDTGKSESIKAVWNRIHSNKGGAN